MITTDRVAGRGAAFTRLKDLHRRATLLEGQRATLEFRQHAVVDEIRCLEQKLDTTASPVLQADRLLAVAWRLFKEGKAYEAQDPAREALNLYYVHDYRDAMVTALRLLDRIEREVG